MRTRACAGLREWGAGARRRDGTRRLPQPSVPGSSTLSGIPAATLARDAKSEHTTAPPRALSAWALACPWVRGVGARPSIGFLVRT